MRLLTEYAVFRKFQFITTDFNSRVSETLQSDYDDKFGITQQLESDVKDIFVELSDLGFSVDVQRWIDTSNIICVILSPIDSEGIRDRINISIIRDYAMMLIDYMKIKYIVKAVKYTVCLGDFGTPDTMLYNYDEFPDEVANLDTDEFCMDIYIDE